jgi:putative sterol carrier protein
MVFWLANRNKEAQKLMGGWNRTIQFDIEGAPPFFIGIQEGRGSLGKGTCDKPNLTMKTTEGNFRRMLRGEIQFEEAFVRKQFEAIGPVHDAARFKRVVGLVLESHGRLIGTFRSVFGRFI